MIIHHHLAHYISSRPKCYCQIHPFNLHIKSTFPQLHFAELDAFLLNLRRKISRKHLTQFSIVKFIKINSIPKEVEYKQAKYKLRIGQGQNILREAVLLLIPVMEQSSPFVFSIKFESSRTRKQFVAQLSTKL